MKKIVLLFGVFSILFYSCFNGKDKGTGVFKPSSAGKLYEIITVVEPDLWKTSVGDEVEKYFMQAMVGLPQPEPLFTMKNIQHSSFNKLFKSHRNILNIRVSEYVDSVGIIVLRDYWASPQLYVEITAFNSQQFDSLMNEKGQRVLNLFLNEERTRLQSAYKKMEDQSIRRALNEKHELVLNVPSKYRLDVNKEHFVWISHETPKLSQGIFIWDYPYTDKKQLSKNQLILARDSVLLKNVPGEEEGTYMSTEHRWPTEYTQKQYKGNYAIEMRGLWEVEGDFMGGPFVNLTLVDTIHNRLITVEGYVYAGKQNKRNFLRELEAIMYTLELTPKKE